MSNQPKHSKLPYHVNKHNIVLGASGFEFHQYGQGKAEIWEANAEFICRAANSHYALLKACKRALAILNACEGGKSADGETLYILPEILRIESAVQQAECEQEAE